MYLHEAIRSKKAFRRIGSGGWVSNDTGAAEYLWMSKIDMAADDWEVRHEPFRCYLVLDEGKLWYSTVDKHQADRTISELGPSYSVIEVQEVVK